MLITLKNKDTLKLDEHYLRCSIGKNGVSSKKIEGDKCTPKGEFKFGTLYYRADRVKKPITKILSKVIKKIWVGVMIFLANFITKMETRINEGVEDKKRQNKILREKIDRYFSNSVLIIDEAQNIKEGENGKMLPPILEKIVKYSTNMKLLLLSATPMFDNAKEIIWLINLLLLNDKKPQLNTKTYFDKNGHLKKEREFLRFIQGYTSYVRGEDPYRFPERLYPVKHRQYISRGNMPIKDKNDKVMEPDNRIKNLHLIGCPMTGFQLEIYNKLDKSPDKHGSFNKPAIMCSNITFPSNTELEDSNLHRFIGDNGFSSIVDKTKANRKVRYSIKDGANANTLQSLQIYPLVPFVNPPTFHGVLKQIEDTIEQAYSESISNITWTKMKKQQELNSPLPIDNIFRDCGLAANVFIRSGFKLFKE